MFSYCKNKDIDKKKWDTCINNAVNGLIYGYSWYLDFIAGTWDAIIYKDYIAVMPLIRNRKFRILYIYQPAFVQQSGVFSIETPEGSLVREFIQHIPKKFKYVNMNLNVLNNIKDIPLTRKKNYVLDLSKPYHEIRNDFNTNTKRNIKKSHEKSINVTTNITAKELILLKKTTAPNNIPQKFLSGMEKSILFCIKNNKYQMSGVRNKKGHLISAAFFMFSHNRWYYILAASNNEGKEARAPFYILNDFIKETSGNNVILDFEGSEISGIERFFKGFGAKPEYYYQYHYNHLPILLKWLKR